MSASLMHQERTKRVGGGLTETPPLEFAPEVDFDSELRTPLQTQRRSKPMQEVSLCKCQPLRSEVQHHDAQKKSAAMTNTCTDAGRNGGKATTRVLDKIQDEPDCRNGSRLTHAMNNVPAPISCDVVGSIIKTRMTTSAIIDLRSFLRTGGEQALRMNERDMTKK